MLPISLIAQSADRADAIRKNLRVEPEGAQRRMVFNGILKDTQNETQYAIAYPKATVADSEKLFVNVTASMMGQTMSGLEDLLGMPFGCGEQNMIYLAPDIEVLRYLKATGQVAPKIRATAETFIMTGYQRQLTYRHDDGSFSAFGESDESGSLWLTAFVLSTFSNAREVQTIDETLLAEGVDWILSHQNEDGSWDPVGQVIHQEMIGGVAGSLGLSAFVVNSLLDYGQADSGPVQNALDYLAANVSNKKMDSYLLSLVAYALTKAERPEAQTAIERLMEQAISSNDGLHWEPHPVETTAYAAMSLLMAERLEAQQALEWLALQRNSFGGFHSTQDTVVGLKALTMAAIMQSRNLDADLEILADGEPVHTFHLDSGNFDVLQSLELEPANELQLNLTGSGTAYYQIVQAFHVPVKPVTEPSEAPMVLEVDYDADHIEVDDIVDVNVRVLYNGLEEKTGMTLVDVSIPTGFSVAADSLQRVEDLPLVKRIEQAGRKVVFYLDHLVSGKAVEFTFQVKAKYPVQADSGTSRAYLYYDTQVQAEAESGKLSIENKGKP
jgi:CD109 antigen